MSLSWTTLTDPSSAPTTSGVYQYLSGRRIIYIGKSVNLRARLKTHLQSARLDPHEARIVSEATCIRYTLTDSDFLATLLEAKLIQRHLPCYNRILRDNKSPLYLTLNLLDDFPKPRLVRGRDLPPASASFRIYGPFASAKIAEDILRTLRRLIPFCQQKTLGHRVCFYHKLGLCDPCPSDPHLTPLDRRRYRRQISKLTKILSGNLKPVLTDLVRQIKVASDREDYETALVLRNRLTRFETALTHSHFEDGRVTSYSQAPRALAALSRLLSLPHLTRIECYDASSSHLKHAVVSMVVATEGQLDRSQYRLFRLRQVGLNSDFAMLKEALARRLQHSTWPRADLIVIDGGRPQLRALQPLFDQYPEPPPLIGLAKHPDRLIGYPNTYFSLPSSSSALQLLVRLRDEAHRFANSYRLKLFRH